MTSDMADALKALCPQVVVHEGWDPEEILVRNNWERIAGPGPGQP